MTDIQRQFVRSVAQDLAPQGRVQELSNEPALDDFALIGLIEWRSTNWWCIRHCVARSAVDFVIFTPTAPVASVGASTKCGL